MSSAETSPVIIKYSITLYDLIKCRLWATNHNRFLLGLCCFFSLLIALQVWYEPQVAEHTIGVKVIMFLMIFGIMLAFITIVNVVVQILLVIASKNRGVLGPLELEIREDGLVERTDISESLHRWNGFHKPRKSKNYFFLYVTEQGAHVIPKRTFSSAQEAADFEALILRMAHR